MCIYNQLRFLVRINKNSYEEEALQVAQNNQKQNSRRKESKKMIM